jgi:hypothetical protein
MNSSHVLLTSWVPGTGTLMNERILSICCDLVFELNLCLKVNFMSSETEDSDPDSAVDWCRLGELVVLSRLGWASVRLSRGLGVWFGAAGDAGMLNLALF